MNLSQGMSAASTAIGMMPKDMQQRVGQEVGKAVAKGVVNSFFHK